MPIVFEDILPIFESLTPQQASVILTCLNRGMALYCANGIGELDAEKPKTGGAAEKPLPPVESLIQCPHTDDGIRCSHRCSNKGHLRQHYATCHGMKFIPRMHENGGMCAKCHSLYKSASAYYYHSMKCYKPTPGTKEAIETKDLLTGKYA